MIELIRNGKIEEALEFAQEELAPRGEENVTLCFLTAAILSAHLSNNLNEFFFLLCHILLMLLLILKLRSSGVKGRQRSNIFQVHPLLKRVKLVVLRMGCEGYGIICPCPLLAKILCFIPCLISQLSCRFLFLLSHVSLLHHSTHLPKSASNNYP